ncbi:uncharacterized protein LOC118757129, partial [Rhagoletis pomonella]|uniref:uncharacterized protein LOC118757129 n=1 Tax=Rhagoletis pomonella TaxID=28610 RepID=UPI001785B538
ALLDSASQLNFVTNRLVSQLQLKKVNSSQFISGIGQNDFATNHIVDLRLHSRVTDYTANLTAVVTSTITDIQPSRSLKCVDWNIPSNIRLADPLFFEPQRIDMLIGASLFFDLLCVGQIRLAESMPILQKTKLGWIVSGATVYNAAKLSCLTAIDMALTNDSDVELNKLVERFWEVETCKESSPKTTAEEDLCESNFLKNYRRLKSGEFSVRLPTKLPSFELGESYPQAVNRFRALERRLQRNAELKKQYSSFIKEYLDLNHMSVVDAIPSKVPINFLPHHCVLKADSTTTKLRVVFDGSAPTSTRRSLNSILMKGPTIQQQLFDILLRFRTFKIALTADICKMYRCVRMSYPDNFLQCIIWRDSPNEEFRIFKLDTVTYGTKPASFLSIRSMQQLAQDDAHLYPVGAETIKHAFYVDDMISGADSVDEAKVMLNQTRKLLSLGNFHLRKWCSNDNRILTDIAANDKQEFLKFDDDTMITKALGLVWDPSLDVFIFSFSPFATPAKVTKRTILSAIARLYDPLGLIGPVVAKAKIFLQQLWKEKLHWDESPSQAIQSEWLEMCSQYKLVAHFSFDRFLLMPEADLQMHAFCDASVAAYGACIYIRAEREGYIQTNLLCSKSRVAPLKTLTVPRLELSGALLLAELVSK